jgi:hypothetical protein
VLEQYHSPGWPYFSPGSQFCVLKKTLIAAKWNQLASKVGRDKTWLNVDFNVRNDFGRWNVSDIAMMFQFRAKFLS